MAITTVLFDLDGVIRHFDPEHHAAVEAKYGLEPGALHAAAFAPDLLEPAITGKITRAEWTRQVGERCGSPEAAAEWFSDRGKVDPAMLEIADTLRSQGTVVAILTNGTSTIPQEVENLGLVPHFDAIFNTAEIGYAKPDVRAFQAVLDRLHVAGPEVFFTDDSPSKLSGAIELGMTAEAFTGPANLRTTLASLDLLP